MKNKLKRILLTLAVPAVLYGCGAPVPDLYWPEPPDEPRIKYTKVYRGAVSADFQTSNVAVEILLGAEQSSALKKPMGVHVAGNGKIYVTDTAASDVFVIDPATKTSTTLSELSGEKIFFKPIGVASDDTGRIFVSDSQTDTVTAVDQTGKKLENLSADPPFQQPTGLAVDNERKRLYVTDTHTHDIRVFDLETLKQVNSIGKRGKGEGFFNFPSFLTVDNKGQLFVVDTMNGRVQIFDKDGKFLRAFGQFGDASGMFARPKGIAVDSEGHIYVVDSAFNNVQIFSEEGQILMSFAGYGSDRGQTILPAGAAMDKDDYIYVVDSYNRRVVVFEYLGEKAKTRSAKK